jgi:DNA end-binding protein Ku
MPMPSFARPSGATNKVALGRLVLTNREYVIALEPRENGLMGLLLRYPYEVRQPNEYFEGIQDVKITKDMLDLARHIVDQKTGHFEPEKFEDRYEAALLEIINQKQAGRPVAKAKRPSGGNVVDLMDALRQSIKGSAKATAAASAAKPVRGKKAAKPARKAS